MNEYTPTEARQDALRAISDNLFSVLVERIGDSYVYAYTILVIALNEKDAVEKVKQWANDNNKHYNSIIAFKILNALEETIR